MKSKLLCTVAVALLAAGSALAQEPIDDDVLHDDATAFFEPIPTVQPAPVNNPITREKV